MVRPPMARGQGDLGDLSAGRNAAQGRRPASQAEYAETLRLISRDGEAALYHGSALGDILADYMKALAVSSAATI